MSNVPVLINRFDNASKKERRNQTRIRVDNLIVYFKNGGRTSVKKYIKKNFSETIYNEEENPKGKMVKVKNRAAYALAEKRTRQWFSQVRLFFQSVKKNFGCIDDEGTYGFPKTSSEYYHMIGRRFNLIKGIYVISDNLVEEGTKKGLLNGDIERKPLNVPSIKLLEDENDSVEINNLN